MDSKCFLTSTDLQTRRARCQHQLSFLLSVLQSVPLHRLAAYQSVMPIAADVLARFRVGVSMRHNDNFKKRRSKTFSQFICRQVLYTRQAMCKRSI